MLYFSRLVNYLNHKSQCTIPQLPVLTENTREYGHPSITAVLTIKQNCLKYLEFWWYTLGLSLCIVSLFFFGLAKKWDLTFCDVHCIPLGSLLPSKLGLLTIFTPWNNLVVHRIKQEDSGQKEPFPELQIASLENCYTILFQLENIGVRGIKRQERG